MQRRTPKGTGRDRPKRSSTPRRRWKKAVAVAKDDLASVRTGRATPNMFARVSVEYYGSMTPINQLASINIPEARMVVIKPYDAGSLKAIEKSIRESDLGLNPSNDGQIIRCIIPQLSEERRRDMVRSPAARARRPGRDPQRPAQGDGRAAPDRPRRRGGRGRGDPRGRRSCRPPRTSTSTRSTSW